MKVLLFALVSSIAAMTFVSSFTENPMGVQALKIATEMELFEKVDPALIEYTHSLVQTHSSASADAQAEFIKMLMKPFLGPIIDIFEGMLMHKPYESAMGKASAFAPEMSIVSSHHTPKVFEFGGENE